MRKIILLLALLMLPAHGAPCPMVDKPFIVLEGGLSGGVALRRDFVVLLIPDSEAGAHILVQRGQTARVGIIDSYSGLQKELQALGLFDLPHPSPTSGAMDPYGFKLALHVHDGTRCFSYSPQRDCCVMNGPKPSLTEQQRQRFKQACDKIESLMAKATSAMPAPQFQAAWQGLYKK